MASANKLELLKMRMLKAISKYPDLDNALKRKDKKAFIGAFTSLMKDRLFTKTMPIDEIIADSPDLAKRRTLFSLRDAVVAGAAYALIGPSNSALANDPIWVVDYYAAAISREDILQGLRTQPRIVDGKTISSKYGEPLAFRGRGEFTGYFFGARYGPNMKRIFQEGGTDVLKFGDFLSKHRNEKSVGLYSDGFFILFDDQENLNYLLPIGKDVAHRIKAL